MPDRTRRPATMADVAAHARVTPSEVALVIGRDANVPADRRQAVAEALEDLAYRPLEAVQARLDRRPRFAIAFKSYTSDDPGANRFYLPIASALAQVCVRSDAEIRHATLTVDDAYRPVQIPRTLTDGSCDAVFMLGTELTPEAIEQLGPGVPPIVLVDGYSDGNRFDSVVTNNTHGARLAVEHLIGAGHREIALIGTEPGCYPSIQARRDGYIETLERHRLPIHLVDTGYLLAEAAAVLGVDYVQRHPRVTAVFAANDWLLVTFMQVAREAGYRLPSDLSLIGFDDIDLASLVIPALTTLAVDKGAMARAAFGLAVRRLELEATEPLQIVVEPTLIDRESVAAPRDDATR